MISLLRPTPGLAVNSPMRARVEILDVDASRFEARVGGGPSGSQRRRIELRAAGDRLTWSCTCTTVRSCSASISRPPPSRQARRIQRTRSHTRRLARSSCRRGSPADPLACSAQGPASGVAGGRWSRLGQWRSLSSRKVSVPASPTEQNRRRWSSLVRPETSPARTAPSELNRCSCAVPWRMLGGS